MTSTSAGPRIGSLFSGAGGLDLAVLEVLGGTVAWHSQYEPPDKKDRPDVHQYAARILAHHWPDVPNLGDITAVDWDQVLNDHGPIDVLIGGFPCGDLSLAGKQAGLIEGTRSGLWFHMARAIQHLQPKLVIIENVRGLLSAPAHSDVEPCPWCLGNGRKPPLRALGCVLGDLADLGFDAEWYGLPASDIGAPHERWREFITAWPADAARPGLEDGRQGRPGRGAEAPADADDVRGHGTGARRPGRHEPADHDQPAADAQGVGRRQGGAESTRVVGGSDDALRGGEDRNAAANTEGHGLGGYEEFPQGRNAIRDGLRPVVDRRRDAAPDTLGDALRQQPVPVGRRSGQAVAGLAGAEAAPRADARGRQEDRPTVQWGPYEAAVRRWERVRAVPVPHPVDGHDRLAPELSEWMMGYAPGWITKVPAAPGMTASQVRNARLKAAGNGVVVQQATFALPILLGRMPPEALHWLTARPTPALTTT